VHFYVHVSPINFSSKSSKMGNAPFDRNDWRMRRKIFAQKAEDWYPRQIFLT
jgi:hypothetical protein